MEIKDETDVKKEEKERVRNKIVDEEYEILDSDSEDEDKPKNKKPKEKKSGGDVDELMEESSDDEMFTSDESSESNDESSDDPDYFGGGNIKEWKSTSNRAAKKKRKEKIRAERARRHAERVRRGHGLGRKKGGGKRKSTEDEVTGCFETTKNILNVEKMPLETEFTVQDLIEKQFGQRSEVLYVLRLLRCLQLLKQVSDDFLIGHFGFEKLNVWFFFLLQTTKGDEERRYILKGFDHDCIKEVVERALRTPENNSDDVVENIAMDMLRVLCSSRKVRKINFICFTKLESKCFLFCAE